MARTRKTSGDLKPTMKRRKLQKKADKRARDQFAALGMFIQNFENVVSVLRTHCRDMLMGIRPRVHVSNDPAINRLIHHNICSLVLHHEAITASTIVQIWRSMITENSKTIPTLTEKGNFTVQEITTQINNQFVKLIQIRNKLLHASWYIGYWPLEHQLQPPIVEKYQVNKSGLQKRSDMPVSFEDIISHTKHAANIHARFRNSFSSIFGIPSKLRTFL